MSNDTRIALLENTISHIYKTLDRIDKRFEHIDNRFDQIDKRFEHVDRRFDAVEKDIRDRTDTLRVELRGEIKELSNRLWYLVFWIISGFVGILAIVSRGFHWLS